MKPTLLVQSCHLILSEVNIAGRDSILDVSDARRIRNREQYELALEQPREGDLTTRSLEKSMTKADDFRTALGYQYLCIRRSVSARPIHELLWPENGRHELNSERTDESRTGFRSGRRLRGRLTNIPDPGPEEVRVAVDACGVCHSDVFVKEGVWPGLDYPSTPGHEVIGRIDAIGERVDVWEAGERVGWHGGHCFTCESCHRGDFIVCENGQVTDFDHDGGYAEYLSAPNSRRGSVQIR